MFEIKTKKNGNGFNFTSFSSSANLGIKRRRVHPNTTHYFFFIVDGFGSMKIEENIKQYQEQIAALLNNSYLDEPLVLGHLRVIHSSIDEWIQEIIKQPTEAASFQTINALIDKTWQSFHYPVIKYFQSHLQSYRKKNGGKAVEARKAFGKFKKVVAVIFEFYFTLVAALVKQFDLEKYLPLSKVSSVIGIAEPMQKGDTIDADLAATLIYLIYKSLLYIGDLSRYRTMIVSSVDLFQGSAIDQDKSLRKPFEYYQLACLILPSLGESFQHMALVNNFQKDKFGVIYNLSRAALTRIPSTIAMGNLVTFILKNGDYTNEESCFRNFKHYENAENRDKLVLVKLQFLTLYTHHFLANVKNYTPENLELKSIEPWFLKNITQLNYSRQANSDFLFQMVVTLISGLTILSDSKEISRKDPRKLAEYLKFSFRVLKRVFTAGLSGFQREKVDLNSVLLPSVRLILCWCRENPLALHYIRTNQAVGNELSMYLEEIRKQCADVTKKPTREAFLKEDVELREFKPINNYMRDFNDESIFQDKDAYMRRTIGEYSGGRKAEENIKRMSAIGYLGGKVLAKDSEKKSASTPVESKSEASNFKRGEKKEARKVKDTEARKEQKEQRGQKGQKSTRKNENGRGQKASKTPESERPSSEEKSTVEDKPTGEEKSNVEEKPKFKLLQRKGKSESHPLTIDEIEGPGIDSAYNHMVNSLLEEDPAVESYDSGSTQPIPSFQSNMGFNPTGSAEQGVVGNPMGPPFPNSNMGPAMGNLPPAMGYMPNGAPFYPPFFPNPFGPMGMGPNMQNMPNMQHMPPPPPWGMYPPPPVSHQSPESDLYRQYGPRQ